MPNVQIGGVAIHDVGAEARGGAAAADPRELLGEHRGVQVIAALPAVALRHFQAQQALCGELS